MRYLFCLLLLLSSTALCAQSLTPPPAASATTAVADTSAVLIFNGWYLPAYRPSSGADTTGALLSLFRKRRYAGWLFTIPFIAGMSLALPISSTNRYGQQQVAEEAISPPLGSAILVATIGGFIAHATKFNKGHLVAVDKAYAADQPIPVKYRRQLNASHFAEAAYLREAIAQQKARERLRSSAN